MERYLRNDSLIVFQLRVQAADRRESASYRSAAFSVGGHHESGEPDDNRIEIWRQLRCHD